MADAAIHLIARLVPKPGQEIALAQAISAIVPEVRKEPGCLGYVAHESRGVPGVIVMVEAWTGQASLDAHAQGAAFSGLAGRFGDLLAEPLALERLRRF